MPSLHLPNTDASAASEPTEVHELFVKAIRLTSEILAVTTQNLGNEEEDGSQPTGGAAPAGMP